MLIRGVEDVAPYDFGYNACLADTKRIDNESAFFLNRVFIISLIKYIVNGTTKTARKDANLQAEWFSTGSPVEEPTHLLS